MNKGIQDKLKRIADYGCYLICLLHGCGKSENDILMYYDILLSKELIDRDCTVLNSGKVVEYLLNKPVDYKYLTTKPNEKDYKLIVEEWKNPNTGYTHFKLVNWDSLENSKTVKEGFINSWRCFNW